jgi:hypothetical protein
MHSFTADSNPVKIISNNIMAGKGDKPRIKNRHRYRSNYDMIDWRRKRYKKKRCTSIGKTIQYYK